MTRAFLVDYGERKRQVRHYLAVVSRAEREAPSALSRVQEGRLLTLRAGAFLVLYNMIESSTRGAVEAIHDEIKTSGEPFPKLVESLRREVIKMFLKAADPARHHAMTDVATTLVSIALEYGVKLSGNVDAKAIRELGDSYGFSHQTNAHITRNGTDLLTIKRNRNDLAHGVKSFEEVGRDYPAQDLLLLARRSIRYMDGILENVATYLDTGAYLEPPAPAALPAETHSAI